MTIRDSVAKAFRAAGFGGTVVAKARRDPAETFRPEMDIARLGRTRGIQLPLTPIHPADMRDIAYMSAEVRTAVTNIRNEIFRRGYEWVPKFVQKCLRCDQEYDIKKTKCDKCGSEEFIEPDISEKERGEEFFKSVNKNRDNLAITLSQFEEDILIHDDGYLVFLKDYLVDSAGTITHSTIKEVVRGNPVFMRCAGDRRGNRGGIYFVCVRHRDYISQDPEDKCAQCGGKLYDVWYVGTEWGEKPTEFYLGPSDEDSGECLKVSRYSPTLLYGTSIMLSCWKMVVALIYMVNYIQEYYRWMRRPRGFLMIHTKSQDTLQRWWDQTNRRMVEDPHYTPVLGIENEQGRGTAQFIPLDDTLYEMQYVQVRDEFRDRVFALYGVTREFVNAQRTGVGLANEGLQILVTNRMVEWCQGTYNDIVFPYLLKQLFIKTWRLRLKTPEAKDQMAEYARFDKKVDIAKKMMMIGYDAELEVHGQGDDLDNYNFTYKKRELPQRKISPLGGLGAFPGLEGMPPPMMPPEVGAPAGAPPLPPGGIPLPPKEEKDGITAYNEGEQDTLTGEPEAFRMRRSRQRFSGEPEATNR